MNLTTKLSEIKKTAEKATELAGKATEGPWKLDNRIGQPQKKIKSASTAKSICCFCSHWDEQNFVIEKVKNDADLIAASRELVPTLAQANLRLVRAVEMVTSFLKELDDTCIEWQPSDLNKEAREKLEQIQTILTEGEGSVK